MTSQVSIHVHIVLTVSIDFNVNQHVSETGEEPDHRIADAFIGWWLHSGHGCSNNNILQLIPQLDISTIHDVVRNISYFL